LYLFNNFNKYENQYNIAPCFAMHSYIQSREQLSFFSCRRSPPIRYFDFNLGKNSLIRSNSGSQYTFEAPISFSVPNSGFEFAVSIFDFMQQLPQLETTVPAQVSIIKLLPKGNPIQTFYK